MSALVINMSAFPRDKEIFPWLLSVFFKLQKSEAKAMGLTPLFEIMNIEAMCDRLNRATASKLGVCLI